MNKRILVTGAAGFIGFHVAQSLALRGDCVIGLDNFNNYYTTTLKRNRADLLKKRGIEILEQDLNEKEKLDSLFQKYAFTHVLHLAAQAGVRYARTHPEAYLLSNINGFLTLLETIRFSPETRLIYASSSSVYGKNAKLPFSVTDTTDQPANLYAATKKANELMAYSYHHLYGIRSTALRFFTVYGPWGRPDMAYYTFTSAILEGKPIQIFNQGEMARDFTYIDDIINGTLAAIDYESDYEIFNLGNNRPTPLLAFIETLEELLEKKAIKIFEGATPGEVETTYADISHSQDKLRFNPTTDLKTGLSNFIDWYLKYRA